MSKPTQLKQPAETQQSPLAVVQEVRKGMAVKLLGADNLPVMVRGHLSDVPWLDVGDEVLVVSTPEGAIITGRLRRLGEPPQMSLPVEEDQIRLVADRPIYLQAGNSQIAILPDGSVRIDGREISTVAQENLRLLAPMIEVN